MTPASLARTSRPPHRASSRRVRLGRTASLLGGLALAAGATDASTYLALGKVFTANMTGNTVLMGIAIVAGDAPRAARSLSALAGFCLGVACGALLMGREQGPSGIGRASRVLAAELVALAGLALAGALLATRPPAAYWMIGLSGLAMGFQSAAVRRLGPRGVATTYITGTLTGLVSNAVLRLSGGDHVRGGDQRKPALAAVIWIAYLSGALAGAAATDAWGLQATWLAFAMVSGVCLSWRRRH